MDYLNSGCLEMLNKLHQQILGFCRHLAGNSKITAIALLDNKSSATSPVKAPLEVMLIIHNFQPRLLGYVKAINGRSIIILAVDQWVFDRDVERGFMGEAFASTLIFPYTVLAGKDYLNKQEIILKKRLVSEILLNLV